MALKWIKVATGIRYYEHSERKHGIRLDRCYSIYYTVKYKTKYEVIGWSSEGIKQETCASILSKLRANHKSGLGPQTYAEIRDENIRDREEKQKQEKETKELTLKFIFENDYLKHQTVKGKKEKTIKNEVSFFNFYIYPYFKDMPITNIKVKDVNGFLYYLSEQRSQRTKKPLSDSTKRTILAIISQIIRHAEVNLDSSVVEQIDNPISKIKRPRSDNARVRFLQVEEAKVLLAELKEKSLSTYQMSLISLFTGMRAGEILKLTWQDINFQEKSIYIKDPKNKISRHAFMTEEVEHLFQEMFEIKNSERLFQSNEVSHTFDRVVDRLELNKGIEDSRQKVCFHTLRHTFASWHAKAGTPLYTISKLLGHKSMKMTERYAHLCPSAEREAVTALNGVLRTG